MTKLPVILRQFLIFSAFAVTLFLQTPRAIAETVWTTLSPGLEYSRTQRGGRQTGSFIHAFRISPKKYRFDLALAKDYGEKTMSVRSLAQRSGATLAINGGFFSPDEEILGLRAHKGQQRSRLKGTSWWGVFEIHGQKAQIYPQNKYQFKKGTEMAIQVGPRLLVDGIIPKLKEGTAARTALGITRAGDIVIVVTENSPLSTTALAEFMRKGEQHGGLGCVDALNLDGGRSSQLFAKLGRFQLYVPNLSQVTDAVLVHPR